MNYKNISTEQADILLLFKFKFRYLEVCSSNCEHLVTLLS